MSDVSTFVDRVTRTVGSFRTDRFDAYRNTVTGRITFAGRIAFAGCGHAYHWSPRGLADDEPMPARGQHLMCAECITAELARLTPNSGER